MNPTWKQILAPLASLRLTVTLLALSMLLIYAGTIAQIDAGVWQVQDKYFHSLVVRIPFNDLAQVGERRSGGGLHQFKDLWNLTAIRELRFLQLIPQDGRDICPVALFKALEPGALHLGEEEWNGIGTGLQDRSEIFRGTSRIKDGQADFQSGLPLGFSRVWLSQENKKANRGPHGECQGGADSTRENAPTWF